MLLARRTLLGAAVLSALALLAIPLAAGSPSAARAVVVRVTIYPNATVETPGKLTFAPKSIKAGTLVTFQIKNVDPKDDHVFEIAGHITKFIPSGGSRTLKNVLFKTAGRYIGSCPDDDRGIGGILVVK